MEGEAVGVHKEQLSSATDELEEELFGESSLCTWAHVLVSMIKMFLTDDLLQDAYKSVSREEGEHEENFAVRMSRNSRLRLHLFCKADVVN